MATFNYAASKATADALITRFGQAVSIRRTANTGDPWNPSSGTPTVTDYATVAAIVEYTNEEIDGTLVLATDRKAIIAKGSLSVEPSLSDELVIDSVAYPIVRVEPLNPGGTIVLWQAQLRV